MRWIAMNVTYIQQCTNKSTYFKPIRSCNRYDLITGTESSSFSENGVKDFVEVLLVNIHSIK